MVLMKRTNNLKIIIALLTFIVLASFFIARMNLLSEENLEVKELLDLKHELRFDANGKFKIVIFADIQDTIPAKESTLRYMNTILDQEKPDLVLLAGDNYDGGETTANKLLEYLAIIVEPMESRKIPWAHVYGNHVEGGYEYFNGLKKETQQPMYESFDYCISKAGDEDIDGIGNFVLPVLKSNSDKIGFNVFCLDSHSYLINYQEDLEEKVLLRRYIYSGKVYDVVHYNQINWYWNSSVLLEEYNGEKIAAMMLFHIPLYEWNYIVRNPQQTGMVGNQHEEVSAPEANSGLLWAIYERGDVKGIFCGHDHMNDFSGKFLGITMGYTPTIGCHAYCNENTRGARIVEIDENDPFNFVTRISYCKKLGN